MSKFLDYDGLSQVVQKVKTWLGEKADSSHTHDNATTTTAGFMSTTDKAKLDAIEEGANNYTLPTASATVLGGVKVGTNLSIADGVLSATDTTYTNVSEFTNDSGYQTASDVTTAIANAISETDSIEPITSDEIDEICS